MLKVFKYNWVKNEAHLEKEEKITSISISNDFITGRDSTLPVQLWPPVPTLFTSHQRPSRRSHDPAPSPEAELPDQHPAKQLICQSRGPPVQLVGVATVDQRGCHAEGAPARRNRWCHWSDASTRFLLSGLPRYASHVQSQSSQSSRTGKIEKHRKDQLKEL